MPIGFLLTVAVVLAGTLLALRPLRRSGLLGTLSWLLSSVLNESPFVAAYWLAGATVLAGVQGDLDRPAVVAAVTSAMILLAAGPVLVRRALGASAVLEAALDEGVGPDWRAAASRDRRIPWVRIALAPLPVFHRGVRRLSNRTYGPHGRRNRLDVYRSTEAGADAPVLVHLHGGGFRSGRKSFYARAMLHELARQGWVCVSASYRHRPARFSDFVVDVKRVIAWTREHGPELGADPGCLVLAGSSAGAHLAVTAALTANDPAFQPGFESVDTSVTAVVGLYGYYGRIERGPTSPADHVHPGAPPMLVTHGAQDTFVPPEGARALVSRLRAVSHRPVVYAELPGAQHSFDLVRSVRFQLVIRAMEDFLAWVRSPVGGNQRPDGQVR